MKAIFCLILLSFSCSCTKSLIKSKLRNNSWCVEEVEYQDSTFGLFFFRMNTMNFKEGNDCELPYFEWAFDYNSKWEVSNDRSDSFDLTLENSDDNFLDGTYSSKIFYDPSSRLQILSLENERLKLRCTSSP